MLNLFPKMATLRKRRRIAAMAIETFEFPRNSQLQNSPAPGINGEFTPHVSEEIEGRVTEKLSQELSTRVPHLGCSVPVRINSLERTDTDILRNRSGNIPERRRRKPGTKRGSFPE